MKILLFCLSLFLTSCSGLFGLSTEDTTQSPVYSDTIQYVMQYDSAYSKIDTVTIYAWEEKAEGSVWLDTSRVEPDIIDTNYIPYIITNYWEVIRERPNSRSYRLADSIHVAHPNPVDTFYISPIYDNGMPLYMYDTIRVPLGPNDIPPFLEKHPPRITNREELMAQLDTLDEGYRTIEHLMVKRMPKDYISYSFIDAPGFLDRHASSCTLLAEGLMYHKPGSQNSNLVVLCSANNLEASIGVTNVPVEGGGGMMGRWIIEPIQEHAGKTYDWGVAVINRVGAGDTLWFETYVTPFDSAVWDE